MATESREPDPTVTAPFEARPALRAGAVSGFVAAVVMAVAILAGDLSVLRGAVAGLYTLEGNLAAGVIAHLVHGTIFGVVFAVLLSDPGLYRVTEWHWKTVLAGLAFGVGLAVVGAGFVMPTWLAVAGYRTVPSIPHVTTPLVVWHVIYGLVLGGLFPVLERE